MTNLKPHLENAVLQLKRRMLLLTRPCFLFLLHLQEKVICPTHVVNARGLCTSSAIGQTMRFVRRPMPSISISTTSPFFSHGSFFPFSSATPLGVPVKMRSPGSSAIYREA